MAYDSTSKKLYTTDAQGISTSEIAACLGDYRVTARGRDIGLLCTSPKVNKWAKYKPVRHPSYKPLEESQRAKVCFGIDMSDVHDSTYEGLLTKAIGNGCAYGYLPPRGAAYAEPFRVLDFNGYNHKADKPYRYSFVHFDANADGWMDVYVSEKADLLLSEIDPSLLPSSDMASCRLVLLYRRVGTTTGGGYIFPKVGGRYITLADIENSESAPVARFTMPSQGEYHFVAALTDADEDNIEDMYWMYLPDALFRAKYDPSSKGFEWYYAEDNGAVGLPAYGNVSVWVNSVVVRLGIDATDFTDGGGGDLYVEIGEYIDGEFEVHDTHREYDFLESGEMKSVEHTFTGIGSKFPEPYVDRIYIQAYIKYDETSNTSLRNQTMYFDFIAGSQTSRQPEYVSLKQIYDANEW